MKTGRIEMGLWVAVAGLVLLGGWEAVRPFPLLVMEPLSVLPHTVETWAFDAVALDSASNAAVDRNPFRITRRPALVAFGTEPPLLVHAEQAPPPTQKPELRLRGILGPPWEAVLQGIPQRPSGVLVRSGDVLGDLKVKRITRDSVVVADADTVWILTLERSWQ